MHPTAALLNLAIHDYDKAKSLTDDMKRYARGKPTPESVIETAIAHGYTLGRRCRRNWCPKGTNGFTDIGIIVGYNTDKSGFYPGFDYPIYVAYENGTFEYSEESVILLDTPECRKGIIESDFFPMFVEEMRYLGYRPFEGDYTKAYLLFCETCPGVLAETCVDGRTLYRVKRDKFRRWMRQNQNRFLRKR